MSLEITIADITTRLRQGKLDEGYPDREDLRDMREPLPGGWLVATNLNNLLKKTIIGLAAETARLSSGKAVVISF